MKNGVIYTAIKNKNITFFFALVILIFGLYSYYIVPKQENPDMTAPVAMITTVYPGASPEEVDKSVTSKIEDELVGINGYDYCESFSGNSISTIILWLDREADVEKSWTKLRQKMDNIEAQLPVGCGSIGINTDLAETAGLMISLSGPSYSYEQLADFAEEIKNELTKVKGISRVEVTGKQEQRVEVLVDVALLNQTRLSLGDILNIIAVQNMGIPSGHISYDERKINVNLPGQYNSLKEIERTVIDVSENSGNVLRLQDVATITMQDEDANYRIRQNGEKAVMLTGYFQDNKNILLIGKDVEKQLAIVKMRLPEDLLLDEVLYQPRDVHNAVSSFMYNLLIGVMIVAFVVFLGLGARNAAIISTAIPLSILITFAAMNIFSIKIHQISIAALIVALGMLVDNAIVISDAIQVRIDNSEDKITTCVRGTAGVALPVFTSTLTTVAAFVPLLVLPGVAGDFIHSLPQIVIISLLASYLVAILFTPTMAFLFLRKSDDSPRVLFFLGFVERLLDKALRHKKKVIAAVTVGLCLTLLIAFNLPLVFFPKADKDIIYININAEQLTDINGTEKVVEKLEELLSQEKTVVSYTSAVGSGLPKFFMTIPHAIQSQEFAQTLLQLDLSKDKRFKNNTQFAEYLQQLLDTELVSGRATVKELELAEPVEAPLEVLVMGDDDARIKTVTAQIKETLENLEGTINVRDDHTDAVFEYFLNLDVERAAQIGISNYDLQKEINIALKGNVASIYTVEGTEHNILVKSNIKSKEELENLAVKSSLTGGKAFVKQLAVIELASQSAVIKKYDTAKTIKVLSDTKSGYGAVSIEDKLQREINNIEMEGTSIVFNGEKEKIKYHFSNVGTAAFFAVLIIYIIMLVQFRSLKQPLIIMLTIPLSAIGAVIGLLLFRQPLSFMALLGIVSLIGVVVNNAIIMLDYINNERRQGLSIEEACREAVKKRFRPIILTTSTTVCGLTPLVFGGNLFVPMAVSLMSGLIVSTLLTLIIIPVVYVIIEDR